VDLGTIVQLPVTGHTVVEVGMVWVTIWMWQLLEPGVHDVMVSVTQSHTVEVVHSTEVTTLEEGVVGGDETGAEAETDETGTGQEGTEETGAAGLAELVGRVELGVELGGTEMGTEELGLGSSLQYSGLL